MMHAFCPRCGTPTGGLQFCGRCGTQLVGYAAMPHVVAHKPAWVLWCKIFGGLGVFLGFSGGGVSCLNGNGVAMGVFGFIFVGSLVIFVIGRLGD